jgi:hypothetical protein
VTPIRAPRLELRSEKCSSTNRSAATIGSRDHGHASKVKSPSRRHRLVIALHSPGGVAETGLLICPSEKKARNLACEVKSAIFSGPPRSQSSQNCGVFRRFSGQFRRTSQHFRLRGGEQDIRTLGTVSRTPQEPTRARLVKDSATTTYIRRIG